MKPINITQKDLDLSVQLTNDECENQLLRIGIDRYVVIDSETASPIAAFESEEFAKLCAYARVDNITQITADGNPNKLKILLHCNDLKTYSLSGLGLAYEIRPIHFENLLEFGTKARDIYKMRPTKIGEEIVLGPDMVVTLEPIIQKKGAAKVLNRMRKEARSCKDLLGSRHALTIEGKFCEFVVAELTSGRLIFMTPQESHSENCPHIFGTPNTEQTT